MDPAEGFTPTPVPVILGTRDPVIPVPTDSGPILLEKAKAAGVTREVELAESCQAPVEAGQVLGTLRVLAGKEVLAELPLTAPEPVPRLSFGEIWVRVLLEIAG